jgi:hypothetical protein
MGASKGALRLDCCGHDPRRLRPPVSAGNLQAFPLPAHPGTIVGAKLSGLRLQCKCGGFSAGIGRKSYVAMVGVAMMRILIAAAMLLAHGQPANAVLLWKRSYSDAAVSASGTFTTNDAPDAADFYQIVGITGTDNGAPITGLHLTGTPIPGIEPYAVDNLVSKRDVQKSSAFKLSSAISETIFENRFRGGKTMLARLASIISVVSVMACVAPAEQVRQQAAAASAHEARSVQFAAQNKCMIQGFQEGTDAFAQCVMTTIDQQRRPHRCTYCRSLD